MKAKTRILVIRVAFGFSLALAVIFCLCTIGFGTYAIINAGLVASCVDNDPRTVCEGAFNQTQYHYWMGGAAGAAVIESLSATLVFWAIVEMTKARQSSQPIHVPRELKELVSESASESDLLVAERENKGGRISSEKAGHGSRPTAPTDGPGNSRHPLGGREMGAVPAEAGPTSSNVIVNMESVDNSVEVTANCTKDMYLTVQVATDIIGGEEVKEWQETTVRSFTPLATVALFFGILLAMCALLSIFWCIAVAYNEFNPRFLPQRADGTISVFPFITVNCVLGIATPILLFASAGLVAAVLDFVTIGRTDMRVAICYILPAVTLKEGKENNYWVVMDTFYFPLSKRPRRMDHGFFYSCDSNRYTWYFAVVCALSMLLVFSYFVDVTVTEQKNFEECPPDVTLVCFRAQTFFYVNCSGAPDPNATLLHCYKFLRFGVDVNLITALSQSFAFLLLVRTASQQVLFLVKVLLTIHPSRLWGGALFVVCVLLFASAIAVLVKSDVLLAYTDVLSILELFMVGGIVFVIGLMVAEGKWWEQVPFYTPRQLHFVQYGTTASRRELKEIEHVAALEAGEGKEVLHKEMSAV